MYILCLANSKEFSIVLKTTKEVIVSKSFPKDDWAEFSLLFWKWTFANRIESTIHNSACTN